MAQTSHLVGPVAELFEVLSLCYVDLVSALFFEDRLVWETLIEILALSEAAADICFEVLLEVEASKVVGFFAIAGIVFTTLIGVSLNH